MWRYISLHYIHSSCWFPWLFICFFFFACSPLE
jgi:hypothetical protein